LKGKFCIFVGGLVGRHATEKPNRQNRWVQVGKFRQEKFAGKNSHLGLTYFLADTHQKNLKSNKAYRDRQENAP